MMMTVHGLEVMKFKKGEKPLTRSISKAGYIRCNSVMAITDDAIYGS